MVNPDEAGDRRRGPHRPCADGDLHRSAPAEAPSASAGPASLGPADPDPADADLIARIAAGDDVALATLYDRYSPQVYALALAIVGERRGAEEVLIETFYRLWADPAPPDVRRRPPVGRLLGLARELALAEARRRRDRLGPEAGEAAGGVRRTRVGSALAALPDDRRRALELAYFDGLSEREIAERLGRPVAQVRRLLRLAFDQLRDELGGSGGDDDT